MSTGKTASLHDNQKIVESPDYRDSISKSASSFNDVATKESESSYPSKLVNSKELSVSDAIVKFVNGVPEYTDLTTDADSNFHLPTKEVLGSLVYYADKDPWHDPALCSLTGYARDGKRYTDGVQDAGPIFAPWSSEAFSSSRGNRDDFPETALVVWATDYVVIFDATNFPTDLTVWMKFDCLSNTVAMKTIKHATMKNGVLVLSGSGTNEGLTIIDFKGDTIYNTINYISSSEHKVWNGDISSRNSTGLWTAEDVSPSLRMSSDIVHSASVSTDGNKLWILASGDDDIDLVETDGSVGSHPEYLSGFVEVNKPANIANGRFSTFDDDGWLWIAENKRVQRNWLFYRGRSLLIEDKDNPVQTKTGRSLRYGMTSIPCVITGLASTRDHVYISTDIGVYRMDRGSMDFFLAYTISGGRGQGGMGVQDGGEIIAGDNPKIIGVDVISTAVTSYLAITTPQSFSVIRLIDDVPVLGLVQNAMDGIPTCGVGMLS